MILGIFLDVLILFELWVGHRLLSEKVVRPHERAPPYSISSVPVSEGIENSAGVPVCQLSHSSPW